MKLGVLGVLCVVGVVAGHAVFQTPVIYRESAKHQLVKKLIKREAAGVRVKRAAAWRINLLDDTDFEYYGVVSVGTPAQSFLMMPDTGSTAFWVPAITCRNCTKRPRLYDPAKSSSAKNTTTLFYNSYGNGGAKGFVFRDTVTVGGPGQPQFSVPDVPVGAVYELSSQFINGIYDGLMGMGFQRESWFMPVPLAAIGAGLLASPLVTVHFRRRPTESNATGGAITWGALDTANCAASVSYVPLSSGGLFQYSIEAISLAGVSVSGSIEVISDTGTTLIAGPADDVARFAAAVNATRSSSTALYFAPCNDWQYPDLQITINGQVFAVDPRNYLIDVGNGKDCYFGMQPYQPAGPYKWILGMPFIREYCHVLDYGNRRLGLAAATWW